MRCFLVVFAILSISMFGSPKPSFAACKSWDLNCDASTGRPKWDLNRHNKQQRDSIRTGRGSWDLNTDRGGSKRYDLNSRNGCKTYDLNCR